MSAKRSTVQLAELSDQQTKNAVQTLLLRLSDVTARLRKTRDEWRAADSLARSKTGPKGKNDPDYIKTRQELREQYISQLQPDFVEAKSIQEQLRFAAPEAHLGRVDEESWLGRAASRQQMAIENVNGIIANYCESVPGSTEGH